MAARSSFVFMSKTEYRSKMSADPAVCKDWLLAAAAPHRAFEHALCIGSPSRHRSQFDVPSDPASLPGSSPSMIERKFIIPREIPCSKEAPLNRNYVIVGIDRRTPKASVRGSKLSIRLLPSRLPARSSGPGFRSASETSAVAGLILILKPNVQT